MVVSAGNTGALLAAGLLEIGRLPGVHRPAIAIPLPGPDGPSVLIDAGANADARPEHLLQFAHMGAVFAEEVLGIETPSVALLSIGEEPEKGNRLVREAHDAARAELAPLHRERRRAASSWTAPPTSSSATASPGNIALKTLEGGDRSDDRRAARGDRRRPRAARSAGS